MKPTKTLIEAHNYLVYIADALYTISQGHTIDRDDKIILGKYAEDLFAYSKGLEKLKNGILAKEQIKKKELEEEIEEK